MESILVLFLPLFVVLVGMAIVTGRSLSPEVVMRNMMRLMWVAIRWLWTRQREKSGGGSVGRPPNRYRR